MIPYFHALFIQRHGMISALMIYGPPQNLHFSFKYHTKVNEGPNKNNRTYTDLFFFKCFYNNKTDMQSAKRYKKNLHVALASVSPLQTFA